MIEIRQSDLFRAWFENLKDDRAASQVTARIVRLQHGLIGDVKPVGDGISELRIHAGPGYRIYFKQQGRTLILLLCGGDKGSQKKDIKLAKEVAKQWSL